MKISHLLLCFIGLIFLSFSMYAQNSATSICEDGDCASALFNIQLEQPLKTASADNFPEQRTESFKAAYLNFQKIKATYAKDPAWKTKHQNSQIGGKSCIRHYQLEANFAHEYLQNPTFKTFVDAQGMESSDYAEEGFESSRRGINLSKRMKDQCPKEVEKTESEQGPSQEKLKQSYQNMGQQLGYFDEQGNLLKPLKNLDEPEEDTTEDLSSMRKKDQISALKDKVSKLPVGNEAKQKLDQVKDDLAKAKPKMGLFKTAMDLMGSRMGTFLPGPLGLSSQLKSINDALGLLKNFKSKLPFKDLLSKISNLFNKGKDLAGKAKGLVDQSKNLKDRFDDLKKQGEKLEDELGKRTKALDDLEAKRKDLEQKRDELSQKLEDRPRRILEELIDQVGKTEKDAQDLNDATEKEAKLKDKLLDELEKVLKEKDTVDKKLRDLEDKLKNLNQEKDKLEKDTTDTQDEVAAAKKIEKKVEDLQKALDDLKPAEDIESEINDCENEVKKLIANLPGVQEKQKKLNAKLKQLIPRPGKLLSKLSELKIFQNKLKLPQNGIPVAEKILAKADQLLNKASEIGNTLEVVTGKQNKLQRQVEMLDHKVEDMDLFYKELLGDADELKSALKELVLEKTGLKSKLGQTIEGVENMEKQVDDFIDRYTAFDKDSDCISFEPEKDATRDLDKEQDEAAKQLDNIETDLDEIEAQEAELEAASEELAQEVELQAEQAQEIQEEEAKIKEDFGQDIELEPVQMEEWAESFEVKRTYWDAVFHPDDEVVEGYKGRYFEVRLKDANQNVKLLFGSGEYFMSKTDFRNNYGSTIGAFVTEALNAMKKTDREKVKVFIQGSADITGQNTFSGNLDDNYLYEQINLLPQKEDGERFGNSAKAFEVPASNFRNIHLPNLRGQYLKEMIQIYSRKLEPIVLEGAVKEVVNERDRNAIIYLFIPEVLIGN